jgi:hypothetical protein
MLGKIEQKSTIPILAGEPVVFNTMKAIASMWNLSPI